MKETIIIETSYEIEYAHPSHREHILKNIEQSHRGINGSGAGMVDGKGYSYHYRPLSGPKVKP